MKKFTLMFLFCPFVLGAQIKFTTSWDQALNDSRQTGKMICIYAFTNGCEPCQEMEAYTFNDLEVSNFYNENFINLSIDAEAYPGLDMAAQFHIEAFPTFLFLNDNGQVVHRGCGAMDAADFLDMGHSARVDSLTLQMMNERYISGDRDTNFMLNYLEQMDEACMNAEQLARDYLATIEPDSLSNETPWAVIALYQWDIFSREFQYLINNKQLFEDAIGKEAVNAKIYDTYLSQYQEVYLSEELHDFGMRALMHSMDQVTFIGSDTLTVMLNLHYAEFKEEWETFAQNAIEFVGMIGMDQPEELGELAWKFYLYIDDRNQLEIAASWAKQAVENLPQPSLIDTYASLQYKLGNRREAVILEEKALELARELYEDTQHYEYQMKKFQRK